MKRACFEGRADVLSAEEEAVLSRMRDFAAGIRGLGLVPDLGRLSQAVTEVGALAVGVDAEHGSIEFELGNVRFSLRSVPEGVEMVLYLNR
jgi:hypothetical protein